MLDGIEAIANGYQAHASEMEEVLLGIEAASQAHEQSMNAAIDQVGKFSLTQPQRHVASKPPVRPQTNAPANSLQKSTDS
jgi:hypothetical protein